MPQSGMNSILPDHPAFAPLAALPRGLDSQLQTLLDNKTKPLGSLGRLEQLAHQLGRVQQTLAPRLNRCAIWVFAASHGPGDQVSAYPSAVTWQMVENFLAGGAAISVLARELSVSLQVIDAGVDHVFGERPGLVDAKVAAGTHNWLDGTAAMTQAEFTLAWTRGHELGLGCEAEALGFGEMGIGNTASASMLLHGFTGEPLSVCVGPGTGRHGEALREKQRLLEQAARHIAAPTPARDSGACMAWACAAGGFEIVMMAGAMVGAARRGRVLVVDGFISSVAALLADRLVGGIAQRAVFSHRSAEPAHRLVLGELDATPLLDFDMRLGEGTGAVLAMPLLRAACALYDMASFEQAGVSRREEPA